MRAVQIGVELKAVEENSAGSLPSRSPTKSRGLVAKQSLQDPPLKSVKMAFRTFHAGEIASLLFGNRRGKKYSLPSKSMP
jgi:hypothetical protein